MPMFDTGINILNLPLISNFVNYAIGKSAHSVYDPLSSASG
jgi:Ca2+-dependent lipid-binding protein